MDRSRQEPEVFKVPFKDCNKICIESGSIHLRFAVEWPEKHGDNAILLIYIYKDQETGGTLNPQRPSPSQYRVVQVSSSAQMNSLYEQRNKLNLNHSPQISVPMFNTPNIQHIPYIHSVDGTRVSPMFNRGGIFNFQQNQQMQEGEHLVSDVEVMTPPTDPAQPYLSGKQVSPITNSGSKDTSPNVSMSNSDPFAINDQNVSATYTTTEILHSSEPNSKLGPVIVCNCPTPNVHHENDCRATVNDTSTIYKTSPPPNSIRSSTYSFTGANSAFTFEPVVSSYEPKGSNSAVDSHLTKTSYRLNVQGDSFSPTDLTKFDEYFSSLSSSGTKGILQTDQNSDSFSNNNRNEEKSANPPRLKRGRPKNTEKSQTSRKQKLATNPSVSSETNRNPNSIPLTTRSVTENDTSMSDNIFIEEMTQLDAEKPKLLTSQLLLNISSNEIEDFSLKIVQSPLDSQQSADSPVNTSDITCVSTASNARKSDKKTSESISPRSKVRSPVLVDCSIPMKVSPIRPAATIEISEGRTKDTCGNISPSAAFRDSKPQLQNSSAVQSTAFLFSMSPRNESSSVSSSPTHRASELRSNHSSLVGASSKPASAPFRFVTERPPKNPSASNSKPSLYRVSKSRSISNVPVNPSQQRLINRTTNVSGGSITGFDRNQSNNTSATTCLFNTAAGMMSFVTPTPDTYQPTVTPQINDSGSFGSMYSNNGERLLDDFDFLDIDMNDTTLETSHNIYSFTHSQSSLGAESQSTAYGSLINSATSQRNTPSALQNTNSCVHDNYISDIPSISTSQQLNQTSSNNLISPQDQLYRNFQESTFQMNQHNNFSDQTNYSSFSQVNSRTTFLSSSR